MGKPYQTVKVVFDVDGGSDWVVLRLEKAPRPGDVVQITDNNFVVEKRRSSFKVGQRHSIVSVRKIPTPGQGRDGYSCKTTLLS